MSALKVDLVREKAILVGNLDSAAVVDARNHLVVDLDLGMDIRDAVVSERTTARTPQLGAGCQRLLWRHFRLVNRFPRGLYIRR